MATVTPAGIGPFAAPASQGAQTPFGADTLPGLSPEEEASQLRVQVGGARQRIASAQSFAPSVRQQTQSEIINMALFAQRFGNPFSTRRIPFSVLREMLTDPMIAMGLFYTKTPLIRADWSIQSPDAQLAAAVDEALRPVASWTTIKQCGSLGFGYQPMVKQFKLGQLRSVYRDPHSDDPEADRPTWTSENVEPLLWDKPLSLAPENCLPQWDDRGNFNGFTYSLIPLPNPIQVGAVQIYGEQEIPGYRIPLEWAMWSVNEQEEQFGSIYGSPRISRAYKYFWSYWFRWALADRSFENKADPAKIVYYPTTMPEGIDPNDPSILEPTMENVQARALAIGQQARSGATLAMPNDLMQDQDGKNINQREWEIKYLEGGENFDLLDQTFSHLDLLKVRAMFLPESIFMSSRTSGSGGSGTSKNVSTPIQVFEESQQLLADEHDSEINDGMIPQFIAANFPEKIGTPCRKITRGFGAADTEIVKQLIQLIGQTKGVVMPVDLRELLRQANIPLLTQQQQKMMEDKVAKEAEAMQPPVAPPEKVGMQGYNSGVQKTPLGNVYVQPPQRIDLSLSETTDYLKTLPETPQFKDATVQAMSVKVRKIFFDRYKAQVKTFIEHLKDHTPMQLSLANEPPEELPSTPEAEQNMPPGLLPAIAGATATAIVGAWFALQPADKTNAMLKDIVGKIVLRSGKRELHLAHLDPDMYDVTATQDWIDKYAAGSLTAIDSTIQKEMITFLTDELVKTTDSDKIVAAAKEHFEETPRTHADRAARATTRDSYNFGMLAAGKDAGVSQVQAHDASDGDNPDTDPKCVERNGKVMSIEEALEETEHPNGTLHWSYLTTSEFSIEQVDVWPEHLVVPEGMQAAFDDDTETLYVASGSTQEQVGTYALSVGAALVMR